MNATKPSALIIAFLFLMTAPSGLGSGNNNDREATYLGGSLSAPPPDAMLPDCNAERGYDAGGVLFCDVNAGSTITIIISDGALDTSLMAVTCYVGGSPVSHQTIGGSGYGVTLEIPSKCNTHPEDKAGTVRIGAFPEYDATSGSITLTYESL